MMLAGEILTFISYNLIWNRWNLGALWAIYALPKTQKNRAIFARKMCNKLRHDSEQFMLCPRLSLEESSVPAGDGRVERESPSH